MANFNYLPHSDLLELRRWNTPTIYNGWELVAKRDRMEGNYSRELINDYTPQMGPMIGYAVTVEYTCADPDAAKKYPGYEGLYDYLASIPGPKVMMCKDLDAPNCIGSIFGEVTGNQYRALGAVGAITDGYVRDVDEACYGGFKLMAKRLGVGHAYSCPVRFGTEICIYGTTIQPGMLVHADKYGFIAIPEEETPYLAEAARFGDTNECKTTIPGAREVAGLSIEEVNRKLAASRAAYAKNLETYTKQVRERYR